MSFVAHVQNEIACAMEDRGVTQRELADRMGVSETRVSQLLHTHTNLTLRTVERIAAALDMDFYLSRRP